MIVATIFNLIKAVIFVCFGWINLPDFPVEITTTIDYIFQFIYQGFNLLAFFIRPSTIKVAVPIVIILINFEHLYSMTVFILRKIPFLNIH